MNLGDIPRRNAKRYPEKLGLVFEDKYYTWKEVNSRVNKLAHAMLDRGIRKGDRIGILMENNHRYWEINWALTKLGIITVPLSYRLKTMELKNLINYSEPRGLFVGKESVDLANSVKDAKSIEWFVQVEDASAGEDDYESLLLKYADTEPESVGDDDDTFALIFTSGTTGVPKGAMLSNLNVEANSYNEFVADRSVKEDINLIATPMYHVGAIFVSNTYLMLGCTNVFMRHFDVKELLETIERERVTVCLLIPTMLNMVLNHPDFDKYDLSSLRLIFYGGAPMHQAVLKKAMEKLNCSYTQGYGLTETLEGTFLEAEDHVIEGTETQLKRTTSAGREAVGAEVRVVDNQGKELPPGEVGEIIIKSRSIIKGYWNMPEASAEVIKDGWFYTGDLGYFDEDRYLFVVDRKKDMIISGGVNIYPKEIEELLYKHPAVLEAAVIGVPDQVWGESIMAVIACREGFTLTEQEVIDYCKENIASYKKPKAVAFLAELPKNPSGKILKRVLRDQYSA